MATNPQDALDAAAALAAESVKKAAGIAGAVAAKGQELLADKVRR